MPIYKKLLQILKNLFFRKTAVTAFCIYLLMTLLVISFLAGCAAKSSAEGKSEDGQTFPAESETGSGSQAGEETAGTTQQTDDEKDSKDQQAQTAEKTGSTDYKPATLSSLREGNFIADGVISDEEYSGYLKADDFEIYWANDIEHIFIAMAAPAEGFIAIGIQPNKMMKDADIILGYVDDISVNIYDMYSTGNFGPHPPDVELGGNDDILDFAGSQNNGFTIIEFQRLLSTGDNYDNDIVMGPNKIIWAYGRSDSPDGSHSKRGYGEIEIK